MVLKITNPLVRDTSDEYLVRTDLFIFPNHYKHFTTPNTTLNSGKFQNLRSVMVL